MVFRYFIVFTVVFGVILAETIDKHQVVKKERNDNNKQNNRTNGTEKFSFVPVCKRDDPSLNECVINATNLAKTALKGGVEALGVPSLEPLKVPSVRLCQSGSSYALEYNALLSDVLLSGLTDYTFDDVKVDTEGLTVIANVTFPHLYLDAEYMLLGHFQMLPIEGSGRLMANFTSCKANITVLGALMVRKGNQHFMSKETTAKLNCAGPFSADFDNLYTGGDDKSMITEHILNMHSEDILKETQPAIETVLAMLIDDVTNKFFKNIPYEQIFPK